MLAKLNFQGGGNHQNVQMEDNPTQIFPELNKTITEALDLLGSGIKSIIDKPGYKNYTNHEKLLLKTASGDDFSSELRLSICNVNGSDINRVLILETQLTVLKKHAQESSIDSLFGIILNKWTCFIQ